MPFPPTFAFFGERQGLRHSGVLWVGGQLERSQWVNRWLSKIHKLLIHIYIYDQRKFSVRSFRVTDIQELFTHHSSYTTLFIHHSVHTPLCSYTTYHTPLIIHHSSIHYSSYTTHHTPLIRHHSSDTTHHTPLITHHSSSSQL